MSRHRRAAAPRSWLQVIIPAVTLGALLVMGVVAVAMVTSGRAETGSKARPALPQVQVTTPPPAKPAPHPSPSYTYYRVQRGDSGWGIASRFCHEGGNMTQLASRNHVPLYGALKLGRTIIITC